MHRHYYAGKKKKKRRERNPLRRDINHKTMNVAINDRAQSRWILGETQTQN